MRLRSWSLSLFALVVACGGNEPPARTAEVPPAPTVAPASAALATRTASPELQALARASSHDSFALYVDLEGFFRSDLARSLVPALVTAGGLQFPGWKDCVTRIAAHGRELAVGGDGSDDGASLVTLRLASGTAHETLTACAAASGNPGAVIVDGADEGVGTPDRAILRHGDVLVIGNPEAIKKMLASKPRPWATELALPADSFLAALGSGDGASGHGQLTMNATKLLASAQVTLPSEEVAKQQTDGATAALTGSGDDDLEGLDPATEGGGRSRAPVDPDRGARARRWTSRSISRKVPPSKPRISPASPRSPSTACGSTSPRPRRSRRWSPSAASASTTGRSSTSRRDPGPPRRSAFTALLPSPRRSRAASGTSPPPPTGSPWSAIFFEIDAPQYYQYEIKAAKDGKSADIIARGDLDGDGRTSEFKLHVVLDPKTGELKVPTLPVETDGDE